MSQEREIEKKVSFKVVDRRRFTEEGEERSGPDVVKEDRAPAAPPAAAQAAAPPQPKTAPAEKAGDKKAPPTAAASDSGLTFSMFLQSLAQQALMQMGLIPWPHGQRELHIDQARDTIDIVGLLKHKTEGNRTAEEKQLMDTVVYELKMSFLEVQQAIARSRAGIKPPGAAPR